jgi:3-hydroxyisobutyrate dehydrogenase-like beta-hydroxyacid dehydrogenase
MARQVAQAAAARGRAYLDAPVSGSLAQARGRELVFMVGGPTDAFDAAQPLFTAMGRMARRMGENGTGATIKLINNMLSGTVNTAIAEAMSISEAAGLDSNQVMEILAEGAAGCRLMKTKIPKIAARDFSPQFQLGLMDKDLRYFLRMAQELDRQVAVASAVRSQLQGARRSGLGEQDVSAIFSYVTQDLPRKA